MNESTRNPFLWLTAAVVGTASIIGIYQVAGRSNSCSDLVCQLRYAADYSSVADLPLGAFVLLEVVGLALVLAILQFIPKWLGTVGRFCALAVCIVGVVLTVRIAAIEAVLLHGWSRSCVAASLLAALLLCVGIFLTTAAGYPTTRFQGGGLALGALLIAGLSWHLMQAGGLTRVHRLDMDSHVLSPAQSHSLGPASARVQIVEFADFQCPPCRHVAPDLRRLVAKYNGNIRLVQRELPNLKHHPQAGRAAEIAECFGEQGKFWEVAEELFRAPSIPDDKELPAWTARYGVANPQFTACMTEHRGLPAMAQDRQDAHTLGVAVTPTLFIGNVVLEGSTSFDKLDGLLRAEMAGRPHAMESMSEHLTPVSSGCSVQPADSSNDKKDTDAGCR
jgi:protein-disulfide isomerase